jgi:hypothetical protein
MTRLESLRALYEAVKAGERGMGWNTAASFGDTQTAMDVVEAIGGSVDAALAFIAATLPGYVWALGPNNAEVWSLGYGQIHTARVDGNPATALLLAGLAALIAQEKTK